MTVFGRTGSVRTGSGRSPLPTVAAGGVVALIQLYRNTISPLRLPTCRFTPTCSQYAVDALTEFGLLRGAWLTTVRLAKCGPWHTGGWDPIPERPRHTCGVHHSGNDAAADPFRSKPRV